MCSIYFQLQEYEIPESFLKFQKISLLRVIVTDTSYDILHGSKLEVRTNFRGNFTSSDSRQY